MATSNTNSVTCIVWVPQGISKCIPDKVDISQDLKKLIGETERQDLDDSIEEDDYSVLEVEALEKEMQIFKETHKNEESKMLNNDDEASVENKYNFDTYDEEPEGIENIVKLGKLTVHSCDEEDVHITQKAEEDKDIEILETDNLITVGHVEGDAMTLEVYVYNREEESFYVHHDINLSAVPFCLEWVNTDPVDDDGCQGNMVAVGSLSSVIDVWDLDLIDTQVPSFTLGRKANKKKKISAIGHTDSVLCLAWNKELQHILASGSCDRTVRLWDLHSHQEAQKVDLKGKVQDLKWHSGGKLLLSGSCDRYLRVIDCITNSIHQEYKLDGEVESVCWGNGKQTDNIYASTDKGTLYCYDLRHTKPIWTIAAHQKTCTCIGFSPCPGCLITVSEDESFKIWDVMEDKPYLVETRWPKLGVIYTLSCCPDAPFLIGIGGSNKANNFKVWDMRNSLNVRRRFCERMNLPVDEDVEEDDKDKEDEMEWEDYAGGKEGWKPPRRKEQNSQGWKPPMRSKKKKGGHLDRRKK